jgi:hypothetical protein
MLESAECRTYSGSGPTLPKTAPPPDQNVGFQPPSKIDPKEHKARTARTLAYWLVATFGGSIICQYVMLWLLIHWGHLKEVEYAEHLFNAWLPAITGLASSAAAYYFAKDKD